jgi:hypothetical protein
MTDYRTTVTGFVTALAALLSYFGVVIPAGWEVPIIAVGTFIVSLLAKDAAPKES